jgi:hypothetical protein
MIWYVHSRMWMINTSIVSSAADELEHPLTVKLQTLGSVFKHDERITISSRRRTPKEKKGHDWFPAIDVEFDQKAIVTLIKMLFPDSQFLHLRELWFRFTDYGFLNIFAVFQVKKEMDISHLEDENVRIDKQFNNFKEHVDCIIKNLSDGLLIKKSETDDFGVPSCLSQSDLFDWSSTYLYAVHLFLINEDLKTQARVKRTFAYKTKPIEYDKAKVFLSGYPVWICLTQPTVEELLNLTKADNLYLAENACYSTCTDCYQAILEDLGISSKTHSRQRFSFKSSLQIIKRLLSSLFKRGNRDGRLSSTNLRYMLMRNNVNLNKIVGRRVCLNTPELDYLDRYKKLFPLSEFYEFYRNAEELLKFIVHDKEEEEKDRANTVIESILFIFTGLTLYSVIADVFSFLQKDNTSLPQLTLSSLKFRLIILITGALLFVYVLLHRYRKRR